MELAKEIIAEIGLHGAALGRAQLEGGPKFAIEGKSSPTVVVVGRDTEKRFETGVDILLPELFWVKDAVERAQHNLMDFGFAKIPCITVEDLLIAKLDARMGTRKRLKDLDDVQSILDNEPKLDIDYLGAKLMKHSLFFPADLEQELHYLLGRISRSVRKKHRA